MFVRGQPHYHKATTNEREKKDHETILKCLPRYHRRRGVEAARKAESRSILSIKKQKGEDEDGSFIRRMFSAVC